MFPFAKILVASCVEIGRVGESLIKEEISDVPELYLLLALGMICSTLTSFMVLVLMFTCTKTSTVPTIIRTD